MQVWTPSSGVRDDGEFRVHLNPGKQHGSPFALIDLSQDGQTALVMMSVEECHRLRRAIDAAERLLAGAQTDHAIAADVDEQIRRDGEALGRRIAADEGIEPKADPVPWPTGLCGHQVPPGAWASGFTRCRDDIHPELREAFDEAAAPNLTVVDTPARPEDLDDADSGLCSHHWVDGENTDRCIKSPGHTGDHVDKDGGHWETGEGTDLDDADGEPNA